MPGSRRCKYIITQVNGLVLWIICTAVVLNWVALFGMKREDARGEFGNTDALGQDVGWVYEITEVQTVLVLHLNPKWSILTFKKK